MKKYAKDMPERMMTESVPIEDRMTMLRNTSLQNLIAAHENETSKQIKKFKNMNENLRTCDVQTAIVRIIAQRD